MLRSPNRARLPLLVVFLAACGGEVTPDAGFDASAPDSGEAPLTCERPGQCDDGLYCNGIEGCVDTLCQPGTPPCAADMCDETTDACTLPGCENPDADDDLHPSEACGGDDCDDSDGDRYPGNPERCDDVSHDEDCDSSTFGVRDADGDGETDAACCNVDDATGASICGSDCDDTERTTLSTSPEVCDLVDNDCDGAIDEALPLMLCYQDLDDDGYGVADVTERRCACGSGWASRADDCWDSTDPEAAFANPMGTWRSGGWCPGPGICGYGFGSSDWNCDGTEEFRYRTPFIRNCWPDGSGGCVAGFLTWQDVTRWPAGGDPPPCVGPSQPAIFCLPTCETFVLSISQQCR